MPNERRKRPNRTRKVRVPTKPDIPPPKQTIQPGYDFYRYVNGNWIRHVNMPPYMSSYGVSEEIEDIVNKECMEILDSARKIVRTTAHTKIPHTTYLLGTLTESALNNQTQQMNLKFVKYVLGGLRCMRDKTDVGRTIGEFLKYQIPTLFTALVVPSEKDSTRLRFTLAPGEVGLPDPSYYASNEHSISKRRTLSAYSRYLKQLGDDFEIPGLEQSIGFETLLASELLSSHQDTETLVNGSTLLRKFPAIPWMAIIQASTGWTEAKFKQTQVLLFSQTWIKQVEAWFRTIPLDTWRLWFSTSLLVRIGPYLPPPYDQMDFELFGHRMRGQSEKIPQRRLALRLAQHWLSGSLGYAFVKQFVTPSLKHSAYALASEIRRAAAKRAAHTEWLQPATRTIAQKKVENIYLGVAYPNHIPRDKHTELFSEQLVKNCFQLAELDFKDTLEKVDTILKPEEWEDPIFSVNAYYYNEGNRLILPAGILRWPFYHPSASDGWNFGGIGAVIGHEIMHAFDNDGKDFDDKGNLRTWWSKEESQEYHSRTKSIIQLYNQTKYFGQHLNGVLTLSENIADLGGLSIALSALKERLQSNHVSQTTYKKELCDFFTSFAVSWRTKEKKEKALQSLFMDVHSPPSARVNNIVCQFDEWYECFDVKPGHALYKDPKDRIHIF